MKLVGIDRAKGVWLIAESDAHLRELTLEIVEDLVDYVRSLDVLDCRAVIDVPIGLPTTEARRIDLAARRLVGPGRTSSIFPVPMRASLASRTYEEASALNFDACGKKLSQQAYGILDGIRELDSFMTPGRQEWLRERHPEVTFAMLSGGQAGIPASKRTDEGASRRTALLEMHLTVPDIERTRFNLGRGKVARHDLLDALAMLVSAGRLLAGTATILPVDEMETDERGLRMEMVA